MSGKRSLPSIWAWRGALFAAVAASSLVIVAALGAWLLFTQPDGDDSTAGTSPSSEATPPRLSPDPHAATDVLVKDTDPNPVSAQGVVETLRSSGVLDHASVRVTPSRDSGSPLLQPGGDGRGQLPQAIPDETLPGIGPPDAMGPAPVAPPSSAPPEPTRGCSRQAPGRSGQGGEGAQPGKADLAEWRAAKELTRLQPDVRWCRGGNAARVHGSRQTGE